jgi:hypothetical protein
LNPWLVPDVGEEFGKDNHFVTWDVVLLQGFAEEVAVKEI